MIEYKKCTAVARRVIKQSKRVSWRTYCGSFNSSTTVAQVWKRFHGVRGQKPQRNYPLVVNNAPILTPNEKAAYMGSHFSTLFNLPIYPLPLEAEMHLIQSSVGLPMPCMDHPLSLGELRRALLCLPSGKAAGYDSIPYEFFKHPPEKLFNLLFSIFDSCWKDSIFPDCLKRAIVLPILKPGKDPSVPSSYRPISLLPTIGKLLEKIIYNRLYTYMESENLLSKFQSGFRKKHSVLDQLLRLEHVIREALVTQHVVLIVYIDLKAAFDCILHHKLLLKLALMGIKGKLLAIIRSFLADRTFQAFVNGFYSQNFPAGTGVPQGSILSPLLFIIILCSMVCFDPVKITMYADDIALFVSAQTVDAARQQIQMALNKFVAWAAEWGFQVNPQKCSFQIFTNKRKYDVPTLNMNGEQIGFVKKQRFLGLIFDSPKLSWKAHIEHLRKECTGRLNILKALTSTTWGCSRKSLFLFYVSFIRSKVDFGCQVYGSASIETLRPLEIFQNTAMRVIIGALKSTPISSMQCELALNSIQQRRDYLIMSTYLHISRLPDIHPLVEEIYNTLTRSQNLSWRDVSRAAFIVRAALIIRQYCGPRYIIERHPLSLISPVLPWHPPPDIFLDLVLPVTKSQSSQLLCQVFMATIDIRFSNYIQIYTDGSKIILPEDLPSVSAAMYVPSLLYHDSWKLHMDFSVISAEMFAILKALMYVRNARPGNFVICVDSMSALHCINNVASGGYPELTHPIQALIISLRDDGFQIAIQWTPGHCGITSNEKVDGYAKAAHLLENETFFPTPLSDKRVYIRQCLNTEVNNQWKVECEFRHLGIIKSDFGRWLWASVPNRKAEVVFARLRLGHTRLNGHMYRLNLIESPMCMICGVTETVTHVVMECPVNAILRDKLIENLSDLGVRDFTLKNLLGGGSFPVSVQFCILRNLYEYLASTKLLDSI